MPLIVHMNIRCDLISLGYVVFRLAIVGVVLSITNRYVEAMCA